MPLSADSRPAEFPPQELHQRLRRRLGHFLRDAGRTACWTPYRDTLRHAQLLQPGAPARLVVKRALHAMGWAMAYLRDNTALSDHGGFSHRDRPAADSRGRPRRFPTLSRMGRNAEGAGKSAGGARPECGKRPFHDTVLGYSAGFPAGPHRADQSLHRRRQGWSRPIQRQPKHIEGRDEDAQPFNVWPAA